MMAKAKKTTTKASTAAAKPATPAIQKRETLRITDTTLRDAHQSLWATRLRTNDIMDIIDVMDNAGFYSLECWGGATFDVCMRFLRENPWERLRQIKAHAKNTPLQMLIRGQNILGYRNYADDLLERFIALAAQNGIDIFRTFDALNDNRNIEKSIKFIKRYGAHAQGTICYTISPVHTIEKYVEIAREQEQMGVDSICIKDMAGILSPLVAKNLVSALTKAVKVPIQIHSHATSGMAVPAYLEGVLAGAGAIDCAVSSMAGFSSQPPVETMLSIFEETQFNANIDRDAIRKINAHFLKLRPTREPNHSMPSIIDPEILVHNIPGGMISNLRSQLAQQDALGRLDDVLTELPKVRADMGYPPLVTPTSQIVGVQAVLNVLSGERYSMITQETRDYVKGLYGAAPAPIDAKLKKKILGKEKAITCRPADLLKPNLPGCVDEVEPHLIKSEEDIISFCLFPEPALSYFTWRDLPPEQRPAIPADEELEARRKAKLGAQATEAARPIMAQSDYAALEGLMTTVKQLGISELTIRRNDVAVSLKDSAAHAMPVAPLAPAAAPLAPAPIDPAIAATSPATISEDKPTSNATNLPTIEAPLTGTFYRSAGVNKPALVEEGGSVKAGEAFCIIEAMKLFNQIKAEKPCKIVKFIAQHGKVVQKGAPIAIVEYL